MNIVTGVTPGQFVIAETRASQAGMDVVVTGGAGFIGAQLCRRLLAGGHRVICIDNLSSGRIENIEDLLPEKRFSFHKHDIVEPLGFEAHVDRIYNLACPASPPQYQKDPIHTFKTCVHGSLNMLALAKSSKARILQASTSEVYGDPEISPQSEGYLGNVNTCGPRACYDEGKRAAETLFHDFNDCHGVDIRIARIFNTYGPFLSPDDGRVISNFVVQAMTGEDITVFGDGSQTRSLCYRDDLVDGLVRLMEHDGPLCTPVNLGRPDEQTVLSIAMKVLQMTGSQSRIVFRDMPIDDPRQRCPDISRAEAELGWSPETPLEDGLRATIEYFRGLLGDRPLGPTETARTA